MSKVNRFRMWDKRLKEMAFTGFHLCGEVTAFNGMEVWIQENMHRTPEFKHRSMERWNDFVEMQWTGLEDINKEPIYEGDIVACMYGTGFVKQVLGCYMVEWIDDPEAEMELLGLDKKCRRQREGDERFEVIGHIYEEKI